jgi:flotillin
MFGYGTLATVVVILVAWAAISVVLAMSFRTVVPTNEVHIVQSRRKTTSFGKDQAAGNTYYTWPAWLPRIGIRVIKFPVSIFDVRLDNYAAYDKGRVPFNIDILAFFRIEDSNVAAQRVSSFDELLTQLHGILQGASRSILATQPIEEILEKRVEYGAQFTHATDDQLKSWGVVNVKNIELMDIRDTPESHAIGNIMAMKQSLIEKESRVAVAGNKQAAQTAEIEANRTVAVNQQEAEEQVGVRKAKKEQAVGIAAQQADQAIKEEQAVTAGKAIAVAKVTQVGTAENLRAAEVVKADQDKQITVIAAEAVKAKTITEAEGALQQQKLLAEGTRATGEAKGAAEQAVLMAPVNAQITLAKEIGANENYQKYLISIRTVEANQTIGVENAHALAAAEIKVIANTGSVAGGLKSVMDVLSPAGGLQVGAMLEALKTTDAGKAIVDKLTNGNGAAHESAR